MRYMKERKFARAMLLKYLGFAPALANIIPLESACTFGKMYYCLFQVKGCDIEYRADSERGYIELTKDGTTIVVK